jgi:two-component system chemotaxis sensor kinase CheA
MSKESTRQSFSEEAEELLAELEAGLLALEMAPEDGELMGRVFRALHTIKGGAGMFGLVELAAFVHEVETIFDLVRKELLPVGNELISLSLTALDHLKTLIGGDHISSSNGQDIICRLKNLAPREAPPASPPIQQFDSSMTSIQSYLGLLTEFEVARIRANVNRKRRVYALKKEFSLADLDDRLADVTALLKHEGELLSKIPRMEQQSSGSIMFELLFASGMDNHALVEMLGVPPEEIDCHPLVDGGQPANVETPRSFLQTTYRLRFLPAADMLAAGLDPVDCFQQLKAFGPCKVVAQMCMVPQLEELSPGECFIYWDIILTTDRGKDAIRGVFSAYESCASLEIAVIDSGSGMDPSIDSRKLGEILVERGDLAPEELQKVLVEQRRVGEMLVAKGIVAPHQVESALAEQQHLREVHQERQNHQAATTIRVPTDKLDNLITLVGELVTVQARLNQIASLAKEVPGLSGVAEEVERLSSGIRDNALSIRMLPIGTTFSRFTRLVRDLSLELGKEVDLETIGGETELDKTVLEVLSDPLVHLIRNCIDHGIEAPADRERAGKPRRGMVQLGAAHSGDSVLITIRDDGAGLDREAIRTKGLEKGLISPAAELSDKELFALIFAPGFSTAREVTSVSGRGVGMDVVKRSIESLRGSVEISSRRGFGSTIAIRVPLTLAIIESLLVEIGTDKFIFPLALVEECVDLTVSDIATAHGRNLVKVRGQLVPYIPLREAFRIPGASPPEQLVVITRIEGVRVGLLVDNVIGEHQAVIKSLGWFYRDVHGLSGATIMGDGSVALILDVPRLVQKSLPETGRL